jgi:hypothetical protein
MQKQLAVHIKEHHDRVRARTVTAAPLPLLGFRLTRPAGARAAQDGGGRARARLRPRSRAGRPPAHREFRTRRSDSGHPEARRSLCARAHLQLLLYGSESGKAQDVVLRLASDAKRRNFAVTVMPMNEVDFDMVRRLQVSGSGSSR